MAHSNDAEFITVLIPSWIRVSTSLVAAIVFGVGGVYLYLSALCFGGGHDCPAYSPSRILVAYILSAPIFLMQKAFFGSVGNVSNFDPIVFGKFGWLALWGYYYVLASLTACFVRYRFGANRSQERDSRA